MDAGIIAVFKRRYRRLQMTHALDRYEAEESVNLFAVDQLCAMKWIMEAWASARVNLC